MSAMATVEAEFSRQVDRWISDLLDAGVGEFGDLIRRLPGVYPSAAVASLHRIGPKGAALLRSAGIDRRPSTRVFRPALLPLPHPIEFEWRFAPSTARQLLDAAEAVTQRRQEVLLFGTPGVALEAIGSPIRRRVSFLGEDNPVTRRLSELNAASGLPITIQLCGVGRLPPRNFGAVVIDPPWYLDFIRPMLSAAAAACRLGGHLFASLMPTGARASADEDLRTVVRFAQRIGLAVADHRPCALTYDTPFFEANALVAAGLPAFPDWRRGDLIVFRKERDHTRQVSTDSVRKTRWREVEIGAMRLFVRTDEAPSTPSQGLTTIVPGDVLPTVSRRDPRRRRAQVWTSGNRIFATARPDLVIEAALAARPGQKTSSARLRSWDRIDETHACEQLRQELRELAAIELMEEQAGWSGFGGRRRGSRVRRAHPSGDGEPFLAELPEFRS